MSESTTSESKETSNGSRRGRSFDPSGVVITLLVVALLGATWSLAHRGSSARSTISVTGSATVTGRPDTIDFQIGVHTVEATASQALEVNNAKVRALINALVADGVRRADLQTSGLNLNQNFSPSGVANGFAVDDTLSVTSHDLAGAGTTIDRAVRAAGNGVTLGGVSLSISNEQSLLTLARSRAVVRARSAADELAKAAGTQVTGVVSLTSQATPYPPIVYGMMKATDAVAPGASSVPVQAGTESVSVQVNAVFTMSK